MQLKLEQAARELGITVEDATVNTLNNICFQIHFEAFMFPDAEFDMDAFAARLHKVNGVLLEIDLDAYQEQITSNLILSTRNVPYKQAYMIYGRLWAFQTMARLNLKAE